MTCTVTNMDLRILATSTTDPARAGEPMLEAVKQAEGGAGSGGEGWRCAGEREPCSGEEGLEAGEAGLEWGFCQDYLNLQLCLNHSVLPVVT